MSARIEGRYWLSKLVSYCMYRSSEGSSAILVSVAIADMEKLKSEMILPSHFAEHHMLGSLAKFPEREAEKWHNQADRPRGRESTPEA